MRSQFAHCVSPVPVRTARRSSFDTRHVATRAELAREIGDGRTPMSRNPFVEREIGRVHIGAHSIPFGSEHLALCGRRRKTCTQWLDRAAALRFALGEICGDVLQRRERSVNLLHAFERGVLGCRQSAAHRVQLALHLHQLGGVAHRAAVEFPVQLSNALLERGGLELGEPCARAELLMFVAGCGFRSPHAIEFRIPFQ